MNKFLLNNILSFMQVEESLSDNGNSFELLFFMTAIKQCETVDDNFFSFCDGNFSLKFA